MDHNKKLADVNQTVLEVLERTVRTVKHCEELTSRVADTVANASRGPKMFDKGTCAVNAATTNAAVCKQLLGDVQHVQELYLNGADLVSEPTIGGLNNH